MQEQENLSEFDIKVEKIKVDVKGAVKKAGVYELDSNATVTYYVEVTNYGNTDVGIYSISGLPGNLTYTISDYTLKNKKP